MEPLLLRPADAAKSLGLSRGRIYELLTAGEIDSIKVGGARLIPVESLRRWVERQREGLGGSSTPPDRDAIGAAGAVLAR